eukprot:4354217-Prymnesium_polylepis.2
MRLPGLCVAHLSGWRARGAEAVGCCTVKDNVCCVMCARASVMSRAHSGWRGPCARDALHGLVVRSGVCENRV